MDWSQWAALVFTGVYTVAASAGFWKFFSQRQKEKNAEVLLLLGISRELFHTIGAAYLERGWVYREEYESLVTHIYAPYKVLGGNGTADRIMEEIGELPFRSSVRPLKYYEEERLLRRTDDSDDGPRPS